MTDTQQPSAAIRAEFNPLIRPYLVVYGALILMATIVFIPLALIWICGIGQWWSRHYFDKLECELTDSALRFRKGILVVVEKTIPLENIQDITFIEGPLLKRFDLSILKFETAGQNSDQANEMKLIGIVQAEEFRRQILKRREAQKLHHTSSVPYNQSTDERLQLLRAMLQRLDEIAASLRHTKD